MKIGWEREETELKEGCEEVKRESERETHREREIERENTQRWE